MPSGDVRAETGVRVPPVTGGGTPSGTANASSRGWPLVALKSLTTRGRSFLAGGIAATACAFLLGGRDLFRVGLLLILLPTLTSLVLARAHYRLSLHRAITPMRVVAGASTKVRLEMEHLSRGLTRVLLAEDHVPPSLGPSPRFVISRLPGGRRAAVTYSVRTTNRGLYEIGPLRLTLADPFGLCEVTRSFTATDPLTVLPRTWPIPGLPRGGQWSGSGEFSQGSATAGGEQDLTVREYRYGDELKRVHWRSSARRGELMVRRDEQPRERRATVLMDSRAAAHHGQGMASSFEWTISASASVANALIEGDYTVRLLTDGSPASWVSPRGSSGALTLLDRLAVASTTGTDTLRAQITALGRTHNEGLVVAVLAELDQSIARALAATRHGSTAGVAVVLRSWEWGASEVSPAVVQQHERCLAMLSGSGWHVSSAGPRDDVPLAWQRALAAGPGWQRSRTAGNTTIGAHRGATR